ncbi:MAG: O-antigen ligase family protein [Bacteroidales bacterium]|nr:O-antigen ligase family protein [Bacteroidales bacterium]
MKIPVSREDLHRKVYLSGLALLVCCLPLSRYLLSISLFILLINWLAEGRFRQKFTLIRQNPSTLLFASIFVVYCAGLFHTQNLNPGLARVKNVLPLLLLPLVVGTTQPLSGKQFRQLLLLFSAAVTASSLVCLIHYFIKGMNTNGNFREVSIFMHHIRFSLLIVMAIFILLYYFSDKRDAGKIPEKMLLAIGACFLIAFLFFLRSFTGILIFMAIALVFILNRAIRNPDNRIRHAAFFLVALAFTGIFIVTLLVYRHNFHARPGPPVKLELFTANGNPYTHDTLTGAMENGHFIDLYVCEPEMKKEWDRVSRISYEGKDLKGQPVDYTLRRYLTSKGFRKDSAGISNLSHLDIQRIENGLANYKFRNNPGIYQRLYETLWELHILSRTGYVMQHSMGQRIAFLQASGTPLKENLWTGVGTGDVYESMRHSAQDKKLVVDPLWEGKPHNQFLFFMLAFGLPGFLYLMICLGLPVLANKASRFLLFNVFAGIMVTSMLVLDTFESYDSMVFFAFFYCLFVFGSGKKEENKSGKISQDD